MRDGGMAEPGGAAVSIGIELGAVSLKWVRRLAHGRLCLDVVRHEGNARDAARRLGLDRALGGGVPALVTGRATRALFDLPYRSEAECVERALEHHEVQPDLVLALGGETFVLYTLRSGRVRNISSSSRCGAGSGEFVHQQLDRMGLSLEEGLRAAEAGRHVPLSTRCSVHFKSDATHKLNKKECSPADIARTLVEDLSEKVSALVRLADWPAGHIVLAGGLVHNAPFVRALERRLPQSRVALVEHGAALEALGAALLAADAARDGVPRSLVTPPPGPAPGVIEVMAPLGRAAGRLDFRAGAARPRVVAGAEYVLGVDAGSTTTKAVLLGVADGAIAASAYVRTHGNPVAAAQRCVASLRRELDDVCVEIVAAATTGSGRKIASVLLGGCLDVNEIMSHGRAAVEEVPGVDAVLEIGGQDAKFIAFEGGTPVDYAMNEGCSAGTGSFLEEAVGSDLGFPVEAISALAESSERPLAFGERCAAHINSEARSALHQGSETRDVVAGMVYAIANNYLSRVVGARRIGTHVLFQGGVALNRSVGLALASLLQRTIVVPRHPELMGCVGAALLARDRLRDGSLARTSFDLARIERAEVDEQAGFRCAGCDSGCAIRRISVDQGQVFPFGGACTLHERTRSPRRAATRGTDLVARRNAIVFEGARSPGPEAARGTVGVPRCLTTYTFFPFYRALLAGMGYQVVLSEVSADGVGLSHAPTCHPCEIAHGAVRDLVERPVDHLFIPQVIDGLTRPDALHSYLCWNTAGIARSTGAAVKGAAERILAPTIGFSDALEGATSREVWDMARRLGVSRVTAQGALRAALAAQRDATERCRALGRAALEGSTRPLVILCGRPYVVCDDELNQRLPAIITERGYDVVSSDMLPPREGTVHARNVWHQTQHMEDAVAQAVARPRTYVVLVSTFSCTPDAMMSHVLRERLGNAVFCYLEIDAHTASAGFETRVEAFLDIVDEAERRGAAQPGPGANRPAQRSGELAT